MKYFLAVLTCIGVCVAYVLIGAALFGWEHGGGVIPMLILFAALGAIWREMTKAKTSEAPSEADGAQATEAAYSSDETIHQRTVYSGKPAMWIAFALLTLLSAGVIVVRLSKAPAAMRADDRSIANEFGYDPVYQYGEMSTSPSQFEEHTPSLEETVRDEFGNASSIQMRRSRVRRATLINLRGVYVDVGWGNEDQNLLNKDQVRTDVELKLRYAGINVLSEEQYLITKGRPLLFVKAFVLPSRSDGSFLGAAFSLELNEQVLLERDPDVALYLTTWEDFGTGAEIVSGADAKAVERKVRQEVKSLVEHFIDDYFSINSAPPNEPTGPEIQFMFAAGGDKYSNVSLKGLRRIHIPQLCASNISVKTDIIPQLENTGITVLSSEQWNVGRDGHYPKKPYLLLQAIVTDNDPQSFKFVSPLQLIDRVTLVRNPKIVRELPVWESKLSFEMGSPRHRNEVVPEVRQDVQDMVDEFINAYLSANSR